MNYKEMSKEQLIAHIERLEEQLEMQGVDMSLELEEAEELSMRNDSFMESHGRIDYGHGCGCYGPM